MTWDAMLTMQKRRNNIVNRGHPIKKWQGKERKKWVGAPDRIKSVAYPSGEEKGKNYYYNPTGREKK